ncbi:hypothetical protein OIU77_008294 [Salix suchowensis]|uniref:Photosystem I subunit VIII n=1 Tax=Salix suchowensis TaxID=1278906 RepID=A0ABQ9AKH9_9ROSI|nr:hypothetical protein OIU77_008294 [Salix suchowensis]
MRYNSLLWFNFFFLIHHPYFLLDCNL